MKILGMEFVLCWFNSYFDYNIFSVILLFIIVAKTEQGFYDQFPEKDFSDLFVDDYPAKIRVTKHELAEILQRANTEAQDRMSQLYAYG